MQGRFSWVLKNKLELISWSREEKIIGCRKTDVSSEHGEEFWGPTAYKGEEQNLNLINAALAFHDLFYTAPHIYSRYALFFSSSTFAKGAYTYLGAQGLWHLFLSDQWMCCEINPSAAVCHWWAACFPRRGHRELAEGRKGDYETGKGTQDREADSTDTSQFNVWP